MRRWEGSGSGGTEGRRGGGLEREEVREELRNPFTQSTEAIDRHPHNTTPNNFWASRANWPPTIAATAPTAPATAAIAPTTAAIDTAIGIDIAILHTWCCCRRCTARTRRRRAGAVQGP